MKKRIKLFIVAFLFIISWSLHTKTMAALDCKNVADDKVRYVNATFSDINYEEFNAYQRQIDTKDYYALSLEERYKIDSNYILTYSTENKCSGGMQNGFLDVGCYGNSSGVVQGLVKDKLVNGNISLSDKYKNIMTFFPSENINHNVFKEVLVNWKFPFIKESNGYYSFNSDNYHVYKDYSTNTFKLHEGKRNGFFPFNNCNDDTSIMNNRSLIFTAKIEIPFVMTKDGKIINKETKQYEDMVFNFSGDDDVWVFVDDELVLDLGGCHMKLQGNINFAKNEVYYESVFNEETKSDDHNIYKKAFADGMLSQGEHTLTLFYMERAGGESNLFASFNLQSGGVEAKYIDINTNEVLDLESQSGPVGEKVLTKAKDILGYTLVKKPEKEEFTLTESLQTVNYYYAKNTKVVAKYIDEVSKEEIAQSTIINGIYGNSYKTDKKEITNYDFTKVEGEPERNYEGGYY